MKSIGYHPDCGTCNYLISSLCADTVIKAMCKLRRTAEAVDMIQRMVEKLGLTPRQGTLVKVAAALRANREMWRAVEMIELLEREGALSVASTFWLERCLECGEYILAGKVAIWMTEKGLLPYLKVGQKVVERLAGIGEGKLACNVRQRFSELRS
ncbi:hypothetical protein UlMin_009863 [Ulmus minor]